MVLKQKGGWNVDNLHLKLDRVVLIDVDSVDYLQRSVVGKSVSFGDGDRRYGVD